MNPRRCIGALLAAAVLLAAQSAVQAQSRTRVGVIVPVNVPYGRGPYGYRAPYQAYQAPSYGWYQSYSYYSSVTFFAYSISPVSFASPRLVGGDIDRADYQTPRGHPPEKSAEELVAEVTRCRFEITVPTPDAIVLIGGAKTSQQGLHRIYVTPPLIVDKQYTYSVEVQWTDESGSKRSEKKSFDFGLGQPSRHLHFPLVTTK
jgi:uncharacterized protein (TIGR03000 family)